MLAQFFIQPLPLNPAVAGSEEVLVAHAVYRYQWAGLEGAPRTLSFSLHTPLRNERLALGFSAFSDEFGANRTTGFQGVYAYRIRMGESTLAAGIQAGAHQQRFDPSLLDLQDPADGAFAAQTRWYPAIGVGLYWKNPYLRAGFSLPRLFTPDGETRYLSAQAAARLELSDDWAFHPGLLGWWASRLPWTLQAEGALVWKDRLRGSLFWRNGLQAQAAGATFACMLENGLRLGLVYEYPLGGLIRATAGSFECMVGYAWQVRRRRVVTPRFF